MQFTKFGHACVRLDTGQGRIVIDPGAYSDTERALDGADAVFITHEHADHVDEAALRRLHAFRPEAHFYGPASLAERLEDLPFACVSAGDAVPAAGTEVKVFGKDHAVVHPDIPTVTNVAYLVDGVYHPGDSLTVPDMPVTTLLLPVAGPWLKISEAVDFARAIGAAAVHPIHDAVLSEIGTGIPDRLLPRLVGDSYSRVPDGDTVTL